MIKSNLHPAMYRINRRCERLYGSDLAELMTKRLDMMMGRYGVGFGIPPEKRRWDENDAVLITYADMISHGAEPPLTVLKRFADRRLKGAVNTVHLLPFFPWSSDDEEKDLPAGGRWE